MTAIEFRETCRALGLTVSSLAALTHRRPRSVRAYLYGERAIPPDVVAAVQGVKQMVESGTRLTAPTMQEFESAKAEWDRTFWQAAGRVSSIVHRYESAVLAMCRECEPDSETCRQADCPLRPVSPFILKRATTQR